MEDKIITEPMGRIEIVPKHGETLIPIVTGLLKNGYEVLLNTDCEGVVIITYSFNDPIAGYPYAVWIEP